MPLLRVSFLPPRESLSHPGRQVISPLRDAGPQLQGCPCWLVSVVNPELGSLSCSFFLFFLFIFGLHQVLVETCGIFVAAHGFSLDVARGFQSAWAL